MSNDKARSSRRRAAKAADARPTAPPPYNPDDAVRVEGESERRVSARVRITESQPVRRAVTTIPPAGEQSGILRVPTAGPTGIGAVTLAPETAIAHLAVPPKEATSRLVNPTEALVLAAIDGARSVHAIAIEAGLPLRTAQDALAALATRGVVALR